MLVSYRQGLGKEGQGRVEPVEIVILPAGKSLDVCAQLREEKRVKVVDGLQKRRRRRKGKANKTSSARDEGPTDMFEFLNTKVFSRGGLLVLRVRRVWLCVGVAV